MKNTIYAIVIVLCLIVAGVVFLLTRSGSSGGINDIKRGEKMVWVKCNNPKCNAEYQMDQRDYFEQIQEKQKVNPLSMQTPALNCEKCGEPSVFLAEKCEKCGKVFFSGTSKDFPDRCPDCGYSKTEATRKERLKQRAK
jgi:DNA-directed RNA polymerase subunit RPC12/RpoP